MPPRQRLARLNARFDVKHVDHDLRRAGAADRAVYELGVAHARIIVTQNVRHFRKQAGTKADAGIIGVPPHWPPQTIDSRLTALLLRHGPAYFRGRLVALDAADQERRAA